jgi:hypothetical protein
LTQPQLLPHGISSPTPLAGLQRRLMLRNNLLLLAFLLVAAITTAQQGNPLLNGAVNREGGVMVLLKACEPLVKGNIVQATATVLLGVGKTPTTSFDPIGVVYTDSLGSFTVASGAWVWVVHSGPCQVLTDSAASLSNILCTSTTTRGTANDVGSPPPVSTADHFREVGHLLQSVPVATLAWAIVHWN